MSVGTDKEGLTDGKARKNYNHGQKSWDTFAFLGRFPIHTGPTLPSPNKQCWTHVSWIFFEFQLCTLYRVGGRGNSTKVSKRMHCFNEGTKKWQKNMNIEVLSQGLSSRIVERFRSSLIFLHQTWNLYHVAKFSLNFAVQFTVYYFFYKFHSFTLVISCF